MSIAELHERLELTRQENEEQSRRKRDEIIKAKIHKEQSLVEKLNFVNKFRNELSSGMSVGVGRTDQRHRDREREPMRRAQAQAENSESVLMLKKRIEERRADRIRAGREREAREQPLAVRNQTLGLYSNQRVRGSLIRPVCLL